MTETWQQQQVTWSALSATTVLPYLNCFPAPTWSVASVCCPGWRRGGDQNSCPLCRAPILPGSAKAQGDLASQVDALPTDFATAAVVESSKALNGGHTCSCCEDEGASLFCLQCGIKLCSACAKAHAKIPATRDHGTEKLDDLSAEQLALHYHVPCANHSTEQAKLYCTHHEELVCVLCVASAHRKCCDVEGIEAVGKVKREELKAEVKKLEEKEAALTVKINKLDIEVSGAQAMFKAMKDDIRVTFDDLQHSLEVQRIMFISDVQHREDTFLTERKSFKLELENHKSDLSAHRSTAERLVTDATDSSLLGMIGKLKARLDALKSQDLPKDPEVAVGSLTFNRDIVKMVKKALAVMGRLTDPRTTRQNISDDENLLCSVAGKLLGLEVEGPAYAAVIRAGDRVRAGRDWCYGFRFGSLDGSPPGLGTVAEVPADLTKHYVKVVWDKGNSNKYHMGKQNKYDLKFVPKRERNISMDLQSPRSLQELCINVLAEKPDILWRQKDGRQCSDPNGMEWRDPDLFLHRQFADKLLESLSNKNKLTDGILNTFTQEHACLQNVKISSLDAISKDSLQVLGHHKLISLEVRYVPMDILCTLLKCIGNKSYESLQRFIIQIQDDDEFAFGPNDDDLCEQSVIGTLSRFNCLKRVDISETELTDTMLTILAKSLPHVENLNLSENCDITDVSPLKNCQKTLKSLSLFGLYRMTAKSALATFATLTGLTYLDVSWEDYDRYKMRDYPNWRKVFKVDQLLQIPDILPNLECLDLSGRLVRREHALRQFLDAHQSLKLLVLWGSNACEFESLQDYRPGLTVGGHATLEQYAAVLRHWTRIEEHRGMLYYCEKRLCLLGMINRDLDTKGFPPCHDDQLVQAMLGVLCHPSPFSDPSDCLLECWFCLGTINVLLEKGIIRHLEPDTKKPLLLFCRRALQPCYTDRINGTIDRLSAANLLQALENHKIPSE